MHVCCLNPYGRIWMLLSLFAAPTVDERGGKNSTESKRAPVGPSLLSADQQSRGHAALGRGWSSRKRQDERGRERGSVIRVEATLSLRERIRPYTSSAQLSLTPALEDVPAWLLPERSLNEQLT